MSTHLRPSARQEPTPNPRWSDVSEAYWNPRSVAIVGAGSRTSSMGYRQTQMLVDAGYAGDLAVVNESSRPVLGVKAFDSISAIPTRPDVVFIAVAAPRVREVLIQCVKRGVAYVQILSSGVSERDIHSVLDASDSVTRVIGPNSLGFHATDSGIWLKRPAREPKGDVRGLSFISQSGGLTLDFIQACEERAVPVRRAVSIGNCADLQPSDFVRSLSHDRATDAISLYLEADIDRALEISIAEASKLKPVFLLRGGRTRTGASATRLHTGSLAGDYSVWRAIAEQAGATVVESFDDLVAMSVGTAIPKPTGNAVVSIGNGGGRTVLCTDEIEQAGLAIAQLSPGTLEFLRGLEPIPGGTLGPVTDIPAGSLVALEPTWLENYGRRLLSDENVDAGIVQLNLNSFIRYPDALSALRGLLTGLIIPSTSKPTLVVLHAAQDAEQMHLLGELTGICAENGTPVFRSLLEAVGVLGSRSHPEICRGRAMAEATEPSVDRVMLQRDAMSLLASYGISVPSYKSIESKHKSTSSFGDLTFPVVCKIDSPSIAHKTDVGGVRLGIEDGDQLHAAIQQLLLLSSQLDSSSPPMVLVQEMIQGRALEMLIGARRVGERIILVVGFGGSEAELDPDITVVANPSNIEVISARLRDLRKYALLEGYRGAPDYDVSALCAVALRLRDLVNDNPDIQSAEINPILVFERENGAVAVDVAIEVAHK